MNKSFVLAKESNYCEITKFDLEKKLVINNHDYKIYVVNQELIDNFIKNTFDSKFKKLLEDLVKLLESDEDPSDGLSLILDQKRRYQIELFNKYSKMMSQKKKEFLEKKFKILEKEIIKKLDECKRIKTNQADLLNSFLAQFSIADNYGEEELTTSRRR